MTKAPKEAAFKPEYDGLAAKTKAIQREKADKEYRATGMTLDLGLMRYIDHWDMRTHRKKRALREVNALFMRVGENLWKR